MNKYNLLIDWEDTTEESGITEPLELEEVKNYLRLEGFTDDEDSPSTDFDDDDTILTELITAVREDAEEFTGLSLVPKSFKIEFTNLAGYFTIPFGPVSSITKVWDADDDDETALTCEYTSNNRQIKTPLQENLIMTYEAGYSTIPKNMKDALLKEIAYRYEHRGDEDIQGFCSQALRVLSKYKTANTWLA